MYIELTYLQGGGTGQNMYFEAKKGIAFFIVGLVPLSARKAGFYLLFTSLGLFLLKIYWFYSTSRVFSKEKRRHSEISSLLTWGAHIGGVSPPAVEVVWFGCITHLCYFPFKEFLPVTALLVQRGGDRCLGYFRSINYWKCLCMLNEIRCDAITYKEGGVAKLV